MSKVSFIHNVAYYKHKFVPFWKTKNREILGIFKNEKEEWFSKG